MTRISEAKVCRAAFIRIALETACIKAVIERVTEAQLSELHALLRAQGDVVAREDREAFHLLDEAFSRTTVRHRGPIEGLVPDPGNKKGHMDRARFLSLSFNQSSAHAEHAQILTAIKARDLISASERLEAHLTKIRSHLAQIRLAPLRLFRRGTLIFSRPEIGNSKPSSWGRIRPPRVGRNGFRHPGDPRHPPPPPPPPPGAPHPPI